MFHKYALLNSLLACRDNASIKAPRKVAMRTVAQAHPIMGSVKSHSPAHNSYSKYQTSLLKASSACKTIGTNKDHLCPGKDVTRRISWFSMVTSFPKMFSYWHFHFGYCNVIIRAIVFSLCLWNPDTEFWILWKFLSNGNAFCFNDLNFEKVRGVIKRPSPR